MQRVDLRNVTGDAQMDGSDESGRAGRLKVEKEELRFGRPVGFDADFLRTRTTAAAEGLFAFILYSK